MRAGVLERYLDALRYALGSSALMTLAILSLARIGASLIPGVGVAFHFAIWLGAYKYAYEMLYASAHGRDEPPEVHDLVEPGLASRHGWLQAALLTAVVALGWYWGPSVHASIGLTLGLLLPALLVTLTVSQSMLHTLWPLAWARALVALGPDYLFLLPPMLAATALQANAAEWLPRSWPMWLAVSVYYFVAHYALMVAFRLVGVVLHERHAELGLEVEPPHGPLVAPQIRRDEGELAELDRRWARGEREAVLAELGKRVGQGASLELNERYRERLAAAGDRAALSRHARAYVEQLMARDENRRALALALDTLAVDPEFACASAAGTSDLARLAERSGARAPAAAFARNAARSWPRAAPTIALALRFAPVAAELGRTDEAAAWLRELCAAQKVPEIRAELERALLAIETTGPAPSPTKAPT